MRIKEITFDSFKRFKHLKIRGLKDTVKLVILVGPNGSGKSSVFEGLNHWHKLHAYNSFGDNDFYVKKGGSNSEGWFQKAVNVDFYGGNPDREAAHRTFYFRTAYRNEADFTIREIKRTGDPSESIRFDKLISTDAAVSMNYKRLISQTLKKVYCGSRDSLSVEELRNELIGQVQKSLSNVFDELQLEGVGDPLVDGSFYFAKGESKGFHYKNLSAGEKSAFDLILDLVVQREYYPRAVYCIDEPETHMHTSLQSRLLAELYSLIPDEGQMWITTHSIGMLKTAREIELGNPGTVSFFDFSDVDFDSVVEIRPAKIDSTIWHKFMELSFGELSDLIAPKTIIFCEGNPLATKNQKFDAKVYQTIFGDLECAPCFVSVGSCSEVENTASTSAKIVNSILTSSKIICLIDRDDRTDAEVIELRERGIRVLSRRHLESYLLDDEVIGRLCQNVGKLELLGSLLEKKRQAINNLASRNKMPDDMKSAAPEIVDSLKRSLGLCQSGGSPAAFMRDTLAPLFTPDLVVYQELYKDIFGEES